ncbi:4440_t:CDS:2, partial [Diversispora eburnea]
LFSNGDRLEESKNISELDRDPGIRDGGKINPLLLVVSGVCDGRGGLAIVMLGRILLFSVEIDN